MHSSRRTVLLLTLAALAELLGASPGLAAVYTVTDCGDDGQAGQLRTIMNDPKTAAGSTILLPACTITLLGAPDEDANAGGDLDLTKSLRIQGAGAALTILDGGQDDRVVHVLAGSEVLLSGLTVQNGRRQGGAAGVLNEGTLTMLDVVVSGNTALANGGSVPFGGGVLSNGPLTILNSTITDNEAGQGGGLAFGTAGPLTLQNVTISGNRAFQNGGGLALPASGAMVALLVNVTITDNTADSDDVVNPPGNAGNGGGINIGTGATATIRNVIVAGNRVGSGAGASGPDCFGTLVAEGVNLIQDQSGCTASGAISADAGLGPLAGNGGQTPTHGLLTGSPAIDRGDDATCAAADQRGVRRPTDGDGDGASRCDLGAFEREVVAETLPVVFPDFDGDGQADLIVGQGPGGDGEVRVLSGASGAVLLSIFPFGIGFRGGLTVTSCFLSGGEVPDLLVSGGTAAGVEVRAFEAVGGAPLAGPLGALLAYGPGAVGARSGFRGPASVACADVNGDGVPDIVAGPPPGAAGQPIRVFSGVDGSLVREDVVFGAGFRGGASVGP